MSDNTYDVNTVKQALINHATYIIYHYLLSNAEYLEIDTDTDREWFDSLRGLRASASDKQQRIPPALTGVSERITTNYRDILQVIRRRCTTVGGFRKRLNAYFKEDNLTELCENLHEYVDQNKKQFVPILHPLTMELLVPFEPVIEMGVCSETGRSVPLFALVETVYGTLVDWESVSRGNSLWTFTEGTVVKREDLVVVYDVSGYESRSAYKNDPNLYTMNGKYFDFDVYQRPYFVLGRGYQASVPSGAIQVGQFTYLPPDFSPLRYDSDIMEFLDGFKGAVGEELVRGHKIHQNNTLFMGMELEVENASGRNTYDIARDVMRVMGGDAMIVSDGSLDDGFEIVSIPATLNYHYDLWKKLCFSGVRSELRSFDTTTCGIHIHMSKEAFSPYALGMFTTFINSPSNADFIDVIASRRPNTYCQRKETTVSKGSYRHNFRDKWGDTHDKYWATNLQKEHTLEVRIFNGNLSYSAIMCNLEFCHALHRYVTHYASHTKLSYLDFISWLTDKKQGGRKSYPFLYEYLRAREYITDTSKGYTVSSGSITDRGTKAPEREVVVDPTLLAIHRRASNSSRDISKQLKTIN